MATIRFFNFQPRHNPASTKPLCDIGTMLAHVEDCVTVNLCWFGNSHRMQ